MNTNDNNNNTRNSGFIEQHINRAIEGIQWLIHPLYGKMSPEEDEEGAGVITISAVAVKRCELQINILKTAPRDEDKLMEILQVKEVEYEKAQDSEEIEQLITEIDMLKYLLFLVNRRNVAAEEEIRQ